MLTSGATIDPPAMIHGGPLVHDSESSCERAMVTTLPSAGPRITIAIASIVDDVT